MRGIPARVLGTVAVCAVVAAGAAACTSSASPTDTKAACNAMTAELTGIADKAQPQLTSPDAAAKVYSDAAAKIRSEGEKVGGDVESAASQVATDLDALADTLRKAAAGSFQSPDTSALSKDGAALQTACNAA